MHIENFPSREIIGFLRDHAEKKEGAKGAAFGAAMGAITAAAGLAAKGKPLDIKAILSGAALGAVYGAVDQSQFRNT